MTTSPESKWTKGPWSVRPRSSNRPPAVIRGTEGGFLVQGITATREDADAHLIASAPDLYEALKKAMPFIDDALDVVEVMSESVLTKECREVVKLARAAIAKAEGR